MLFFLDDDEDIHTDLLSDIKHNDDAVSASVVAGGDGSKPLLTCRVPLKENMHTRKIALRLTLHRFFKTFMLWKTT